MQPSKIMLSDKNKIDRVDTRYIDVSGMHKFRVTVPDKFK
jgi:hypothetical protein